MASPLMCNSHSLPEASAAGGAALSEPNAASSYVRSERVFRWCDYPLFGALTIAGLAAILYFFAYWLSGDDWYSHPTVFTFLTVILGFNLLMQQLRWFSLPLM